MTCIHNNRNRDVLVIPKGNPFKIGLCPVRIAPAQHLASFKDIANLSVRITRQNWDGQNATFDETEEGDIIIHVPAMLKCVTYGMEISGKYQGCLWRWKDCSVFRIAECNPSSNVANLESFGMETYYIYDDIAVSFDEEKMKIGTHAHAWFDGNTLHVMESEDIGIGIVKDTLIIKEYGRKSIENRDTRRLW